MKVAPADGTEPRAIGPGPRRTVGQAHEPTRLSPGSQAIDHGDACRPTDQRGVARPLGSRCDIGAVEYVPGERTPWLLLPLIVR